ncbi:MAG: 16S rRNA (cytosine(1402)-N(4))-methyltransferase RsmH [Candidatus Kerfeldbacteria bacterium]
MLARQSPQSNVGGLAHTPVLLKEVTKLLNPKPGDACVDATVGAGGHATALLERTAPDGKLLAIDLDASALETSKQNLTQFAERITFIHGSFDRLLDSISDARFQKPNCILADLGVSSQTLSDASRGFSFQREESPLDMRYDTSRGTATAAELLNSSPEQEIERILREYGEERRSRMIAKAVVTSRRKKTFATVGDLLNVIPGATGGRRGRIHPATRAFQALRIAVNDELGTLTRFLPQAVAALAFGGRLAVITFHSLEDRIVKRFFREQAAKGLLTILTKHPVTPSFAEVTTNPRSRSAKLRVTVRK